MAGDATMRTLRFGRADISRGNLILVNPSHPVKKDIKRDRLITISRVMSQYVSRGMLRRADILLERQAAEILSEIMSLLGCMHDIVPVSGYRTMNEQQTIYSDSLREHGEDFTRKYVAVPGCSEHQTGLAIDLAGKGEDIDFIRPYFPYTGICGRFRELSVRYGFVERYPAGREQITRIAHEPWHFRYVGHPHSELMKERGLTLEEYTDYLKRFTYRDGPLRFRNNRRDYEIFYVPVRHDKEAVAEIPDGASCQVSGNNEDGVVVTLWRDRLSRRLKEKNTSASTISGWLRRSS